MDMPVNDFITIPCAGAHIRRSLCSASRQETPFRHWLLRDVLPPQLRARVLGLPFDPVDLPYNRGRRETHNATRVFFGSDPSCSEVYHGGSAAQGPCSVLTEAFQDDATVALLADMTGTRLDGSFLRIEYCLDTDGFWLEPHTDIGAKLFTLVIYLSSHPDAPGWGTDLLDANGTVLGRTSGAFNTALMFTPSPDSWHGFSPRPIRGVRRSLIVNYVKPEWRSRHELAYPDQPVVAAG